MDGVLRRFDRENSVLYLSEVLRGVVETFQIAHQVGLATQEAVFEKITRDETLTCDESRSLARVALANYFAGAVLMPYEPFLDAARTERYDLELLGHRFRTSFEQVCHRLTTMRRPGNEGIPLHLIRIDVAGNISKRHKRLRSSLCRILGVLPTLECTQGLPHTRRYSNSGIRDARWAGLLLLGADALQREWRLQIPASLSSHRHGLRCSLRERRDLFRWRQSRRP